MKKARAIMLAISLVLLPAMSPAPAEDRRVVIIAGTPITVPAPKGYVDVSEKRGVPEFVAIFAKENPGPWEKEGEVSDYILVHGVAFKPSTEAVKQQKFEAIVAMFAAKIKARINDETSDKPKSKPDALISASLIESIHKQSLGSQAYAMEMTENRANRKAILIDSKIIMPGVFTFPMIEEISFVRVKDRIIISNVVGLDTSKLRGEALKEQDVRMGIKTASEAIRKGLFASN